MKGKDCIEALILEGQGPGIGQDQFGFLHTAAAKA